MCSTNLQLSQPFLPGDDTTLPHSMQRLMVQVNIHTFWSHSKGKRHSGVSFSHLDWWSICPLISESGTSCSLLLCRLEVDNVHLYLPQQHSYRPQQHSYSCQATQGHSTVTALLRWKSPEHTNKDAYYITFWWDQFARNYALFVRNSVSISSSSSAFPARSLGVIIFGDIFVYETIFLIQP